MRTPQQTKTFLEDTRQRIATEDTWTKKAFCKDKVGKPLSREKIYDDQVASWCAYASLLKTHRVLHYDPGVFIDALVALADNVDSKFTQRMTCNKVINYNDDKCTTHKDILDLFDNAIESLEVN